MKQVVKKGRIFRPDEANRTLPLVRVITRDIVGKFKKLLELKELYQHHVRSPQPSGEFTAKKLEESFNILIKDLRYHEDELDQVGCVLKDGQRGIVDYYSDLDERLVYLCWQYGEPEVNHWHELYEGDEERKALPVAARLHGD